MCDDILYIININNEIISTHELYVGTPYRFVCITSQTCPSVIEQDVYNNNKIIFHILYKAYLSKMTAIYILR